jgi:hypothetical protein
VLSVIIRKIADGAEGLLHKKLRLIGPLDVSMVGRMRITGTVDAPTVTALMKTTEERIAKARQLMFRET